MCLFETHRKKSHRHALPNSSLSRLSSTSCADQQFRRRANDTEGLNLVIWDTGDVSGSYLTIKLTSRDHKIADWLNKQDVTPSSYGSSPSSDQNLAIELSSQRSSRSLSSTYSVEAPNYVFLRFAPRQCRRERCSDDHRVRPVQRPDQYHLSPSRPW